MKLLLILVAIGEILIGSMFFLSPTMNPDLAGAGPLPVALARMFGSAIISIGFLAFWGWKNIHQTDLHRPILLVILCFNILVAISIFLGGQSGGLTNMIPAYMHAIIAIASLYFLMKKS